MTTPLDSSRALSCGVRVSGATILDGVVRLGYPFRESLQSLLPLVDELVVNVGPADDGTWEAVRALGDPRIRPFRADWDRSPREGAVLSEQTNLALARCGGDWIVYLQADEVLHEDDLPRLRRALERNLARATEGLVFDYVHLFGSPHVLIDDWLAYYPRAVRAVKRGIGIESAGDAAGFVRRFGSRSRGLIKARSGARVFHYGRCGPEEERVARAVSLSSLYSAGPAPDAASLIPRNLEARRDLRAFTGSHPVAMRERVAAAPAPVVRPRGSSWPALVRAYARFLASPRVFRDQARPFLPLVLTNLRWRLSDLRERLARSPAPGAPRAAGRPPDPSAR
jgi:hypothetical protein